MNRVVVFGGSSLPSCLHLSNPVSLEQSHVPYDFTTDTPLTPGFTVDSDLSRPLSEQDSRFLPYVLIYRSTKFNGILFQGINASNHEHSHRRLHEGIYLYLDIRILADVMFSPVAHGRLLIHTSLFYFPCLASKKGMAARSSRKYPRSEY